MIIHNIDYVQESTDTSGYKTCKIKVFNNSTNTFTIDGIVIPNGKLISGLSFPRDVPPQRCETHTLLIKYYNRYPRIFYKVNNQLKRVR